MDRGLFFQLGALTPARFAELAEEVELAETLGLDAVWCLPMTDESGGFRGGVPVVWLAGLAGQTKSIRLGWGVPGVWPPTVTPVREAEQAATLDGACGGRLDVAVLPEVGDRARADAVAAADEDSEVDAAMDAEVAAERSATEPSTDARDEGIRMWVEMWAPATFSWTSPRFSVPPIDVVPKPVQRPHPPLWLVGWSAEHAVHAGRAGLGFLDVSGGGLELWAEHRECYVSGRSGADPEDLVCVSAYAVATDPPEDWDAAAGNGSDLRDWLDELEALEIDQVVLRAGPLELGHAEACRRIQWLANTRSSEQGEPGR